MKHDSLITADPQRRPTRPVEGGRLLARWPSALAVAAALLGGGGSGTSTTLAAAVAFIALNYVFAAVTARQVSAWWGLLGSIPIILSGRITGVDAAPFVLMGLIAAALIGVGSRRGTWSRRQNRVQLYGLVGYGAIAVAAALSSGTLAAILIAVGLLGHVAWDVVHLVRNEVVGRRYAELCIVLDTMLALTILWGLL